MRKIHWHDHRFEFRSLQSREISSSVRVPVIFKLLLKVIGSQQQTLSLLHFIKQKYSLAQVY